MTGRARCCAAWLVVDALRSGQRVLVAVDGPDAAGRTTLADELAALRAEALEPSAATGAHVPRTFNLAADRPVVRVEQSAPGRGAAG